MGKNGWNREFESRDKTRDRDGWQAKRKSERKAKDKQRTVEGQIRKGWK